MYGRWRHAGRGGLQVAAVQLARDLGAAAYVNLFSELPVKSQLAKVDSVEARQQVLVTAVVKAATSTAAAPFT